MEILCVTGFKSFTTRLPHARDILYRRPSLNVSRVFHTGRDGIKGLRSKGIGNTSGRAPAQRRSLVPVEELEASDGRLRDLLRPAVFTCLVGGLSFAGAAVWQYETMRKAVHNSLHSAQWGSHVERHWSGFYQKAGQFRHKMNLWWNSRSSGEKVVAGLIALNTSVFVMWRIIPLRSIMVKYFTSSPISSAPCSSMLFSMFSHYSAFHLFCNMYVLWSFAPTAGQLFGKEQFLAMYLTAGMVSALTSYSVKILRRSRVPSIGASGAIMGVLGAVCVSYPHAQLSIAFVDQLIPHSFSAKTGMLCLILLDVTGVVLGWRLFDHAAHLGGMLFGIWYVNYGHSLIWKKREPLMKKWHEWRGKP